MSEKTIHKVEITCDRCKRVFEKYAYSPGEGLHVRRAERWGVGLGGGVGGSHVDFDLCGDCLTGFDAFMRGAAVPARKA